MYPFWCWETKLIFPRRAHVTNRIDGHLQKGT
jgi:hypothetical protein